MTRTATLELDTSRASTSAGSPGASYFYRYRSANGRTVIVDSLSQVPASERDHVERIELRAPATNSVEAFTKHLDYPSFAAGFGLALLLATVVLFLTRGSVRWVGLLLLMAMIVGGSGAYFGWLRRSTGQDEAIFATPSALIDDTRKAVEKMKEHAAEQDRVIEDIQRQAK
jgi:hypothetical protein